MISGQSPARRPRILVTRAAGQASALAGALERLGAEPVVIPVIKIVPPQSYEVLDEALVRLHRFDWIVFTSANAVTAMAQRIALLDGREHLADLRVAAVGQATARALGERGWRVDLLPAIAVAESLAEALLPYAIRPDGQPARFLLVRAQDARDVLPEALRHAGGEVTIAPAYRTQISRDGQEALAAEFASAAGPPVGVTLTSSSAARNFFAMMTEAGISANEGLAVASIGAITTRTLRELGHEPHVEAQDATVLCLAKAMMSYLEGG